MERLRLEFGGPVTVIDQKMTHFELSIGNSKQKSIGGLFGVLEDMKNEQGFPINEYSAQKTTLE